MINIFRNFKVKKQQGAITLVVSIILLVTLTLIILFAAGYNIMQTKVSANQYKNNQAYEAAEAGLEFGIVYLKQNSATVLASPVSGFISFSNSSTTNVTFANNSKFTVVYTNPVANNYNLILVTSTGTNADGTATKTVSQQVQFSSILSSPPNYGLVSKGNVTLSGHSNIINTLTNNTIQTGGQVSISGSAGTTTSTGGSSSGNIQSDIQQNNSTLSGQSNSDFFATYFGVSSSNVKSSAAHYYSNNSSTNYNSTLNGMTGTSIWIDQTGGDATLNGSTTIGSAAAPVLLVINGPFFLTGNVTIYGLVVVLGGESGINESESLGNSNIIGGMITTNGLSTGGNSSITFNSTVLDNLKNSSSMNYWAKVAGTWKDY